MFFFVRDFGTSISHKPSRRPRIVAISSVFLAFVLFGPLTANAQDTPDFFQQNCTTCHTIGGGDLTGPDLKDVLKRKNRDWLMKFMENPKAVIDSGDPYATKLFEKYKTPMPKLPGMTKERRKNLLDLIEAESKLKKSHFTGEVSNKPFTENDVKTGRNIFLGTKPLKNGGPACISCHSMYDSPALGGGRLGPDLTQVYGRQKGRGPLSAWLRAPATETMRPVFKSHPLTTDEVHALVAYFNASADETDSDPSVNRVALLLMGLVLATAIVFAFDAIWKKRFYAVRQPLVKNSHSQNK